MTHQESRETYGSPSIWDALLKQGHCGGAHRVARLMRVEGIRAKTVKKWRATTQSNHRLPVAKNTLNRQFTVESPNRVWAGDLTYVWTTEGWLYLAVILDLYSRLVIGWAMGARLTADLAERALTVALANRTPTAGLLHHSDRGRQYAAASYQRVLDAHGLIPSMSRKGNCWDNACVESFFGTLKRELVYHRHYATRDDAKQDLFLGMPSSGPRRGLLLGQENHVAGRFLKRSLPYFSGFGSIGGERVCRMLARLLMDDRSRRP